MNREGAETYLRVLAETEMRGTMLPAPFPSRPGGPRGTARMAAVAQALIAVHALDAATVEEIMTDFDLAVAMRPGQAQPGPVSAGGTSWTTSRPRLRRFGGTGPMIPARAPAGGWPPNPAASAFLAASTGSPGGPVPRPGKQDQDHA